MTTPYQQPRHPAPAPAPGPAAPRAAGPGRTGPAPAPYVSPIPVRDAHLGDALASEWTKLRSLRSTVWSLGVMVVLIVGLGVLSAVVLARDRESAGRVDMALQPVDPATLLFLGVFGVMMGTLCVITLGVLTMSSEHGTGMMRTTLTACPSRGRVLAAKSLVYFALVFTLTTVTTLLTAVLQIALLDAATPAPGALLRATVGVSYYVAMVGLLSVAVGSLVRHSAAAITVMIGVVLLPLVMSMFMVTKGLNGVRMFLLSYSIPSMMVPLYGQEFGSGPRGATPLLIITGIVAVAMALAYVLQERRDV
ncbi:ABC transporter permease subunit [Streptomyces sp. NPDC093085]|uniref:ABC transporter permease subunit n=1 Tax=Streptomyces sp. NPDC093085 TaxID=3155068 RepID=UPI003428688D